MGFLTEELQGIGTTTLSGDTNIEGTLTVAGDITIGVTTYQYADGVDPANTNSATGSTTDLQTKNNVYFIWEYDNDTNYSLWFSGMTEFTTLTFSGIFPTKEIQIWGNGYNTGYAFTGSGTYEEHSLPINYTLWSAGNLDGSCDFYCPTATSADIVYLDYLTYKKVNSTYVRTEDFKFNEMLDTPSGYTGQSGKFVSVNGAEDGVEFANAGVDLSGVDNRSVIFNDSNTLSGSSIYITGLTDDSYDYILVDSDFEVGLNGHFFGGRANGLYVSTNNRQVAGGGAYPGGGSFSAAFGKNCKVTAGEGSVAIGNNSQANGNGSIVAGSTSIVNAHNSVVLGENNTLSCDNSQILGRYNTISGNGYSAVIGQLNTLTINGQYQNIIGFSMGDVTGEEGIHLAVGGNSVKAWNSIGNKHIHIGLNAYNEPIKTRAGNFNKTFADNLTTDPSTENITVLGGSGGVITQSTGTTYINPHTSITGTSYGINDVVIDGDTYFRNNVDIVGTSYLTGDAYVESNLEVEGTLKGNVQVDTDTGTSYSLILTDANIYVRLNNAAAITVNIPANSGISFSIGTVITFEQTGAGAITISGDSGVTVNGEVNTDTQFEIIQIIKVLTDTWTVIGGKA